MKYNVDTLNTFIPSEFELIRETGEKERQQLSSAVVGYIDTPPGWQVNAEYRGEFGGLFPVQCRFSPDSGGSYAFCLCSPGEVAPVWLGIILDDRGRTMRIVHQSESLQPERVSQLLAQVAALHRLNTPAIRVATLLAQEVAV